MGRRIRCVCWETARNTRALVLGESPQRRLHPPPFRPLPPAPFRPLLPAPFRPSPPSATRHSRPVPPAASAPSPSPPASVLVPHGSHSRSPAAGRTSCPRLDPRRCRLAAVRRPRLRLAWSSPRRAARPRLRARALRRGPRARSACARAALVPRRLYRCHGQPRSHAPPPRCLPPAPPPGMAPQQTGSRKWKAPALQEAAAGSSSPRSPRRWTGTGRCRSRSLLPAARAFAGELPEGARGQGRARLPGFDGELRAKVRKLPSCCRSASCPGHPQQGVRATVAERQAGGGRSEVQHALRGGRRSRAR